MENQGYEVHVEGYCFCVDSGKIVRGRYSKGKRHYFSDWELWSNEKGIGFLEGNLEVGKKISIYNKKGNILELNGKKIKDLEIKILLLVKINNMINDPYIAGVDRPIIRPCSLN